VEHRPPVREASIQVQPRSHRPAPAYIERADEAGAVAGVPISIGSSIRIHSIRIPVAAMNWPVIDSRRSTSSCGRCCSPGSAASAPRVLRDTRLFETLSGTLEAQMGQRRTADTIAPMPAPTPVPIRPRKIPPARRGRHS
jgi:hypothetical protein